MQKHVAGEEAFLANYSDGLSDLDLKSHIDRFMARDAIASFVSVRSAQSFHAVSADKEGVVSHIGAMPDQPMWINGGFFVLRQKIFDYIQEGEELVEQPFGRLVQERKLLTTPWSGFWQCMDTFKDKITFDRDTFVFRFAGSPAQYVDEFRRFYGPTMNAFEAAEKNGRAPQLTEELEQLFQSKNTSSQGTTVPATFLRVSLNR